MKLTTRNHTNAAAKRALRKLNSKINSGQMLLLNEYEGSGESKYAHKRRMKRIFKELGAIDKKVERLAQQNKIKMTTRSDTSAPSALHSVESSSQSLEQAPNFEEQYKELLENPHFKKAEIFEIELMPQQFR